jgi:hypothetical protein
MVRLSETELRLFIIVTLFLALSSFLIGLMSLANFAFLTLIAVGGSLSIAVFLVAYLVRSDYQIPQKHYPMIAGSLNIMLGSLIMAICLPSFEVSLYNIGNYSDSLGVEAINLAGLLMVLFGIVASVFALIGGLSSVMKKSFGLARFGSYLVLGWFGTWYLSIITPSIILLGAPTPFASNLTQFAVNLVAFTTLFLLPSLLSVILIRRSGKEFA